MKIFFYWLHLPVASSILHKAQMELNHLDLYTNELCVTGSSVKNLFLRPPMLISIDRMTQIQEELLLKYDVFFLPGWRSASLLKLAYNAKKRGKIVVLTADNNLNNTIQQCIGAILFKIFRGLFYDYAFVPGIQSTNLMLKFGFERLSIYKGFYGANELIYNSLVDINLRNNEFLYVGQLINRKKVRLLIEAFKTYESLGGYWKLRIIGIGEQLNFLKSMSSNNIIFDGFKEPKDVAKAMNNAKALVLLSEEEHWGTVVAEAAACGMGLVLSEKVGSLDDLLQSNGFIVNIKNHQSIVAALHSFQNMSEERLTKISKKSLEMANNFNSENTKRNILHIISNQTKPYVST